MRTEQHLSFQSHDGVALFYRHWSSTSHLQPMTSDTKLTTNPSLLNQQEKRAIILFHRGHEHSGRILHLVNELNLPDFEFFAWDARGCGQSPGERGDAPNFAWMVRDAEHFFQHIQKMHQIKAENIAVVAQSVGAVIAATWVHDYVPNIRALILASPAFRVKLYVPFAVPGLRFMYNLRGNFFVNSYVKSRFLTHDEVRRESFNTDPLIARPISTKILVDLFDTSQRIVADAAAIHVPTQLLISGSDFVVRRKPQLTFFNNLSSTTKEQHILKGFYHDTLGEKDRHIAIDKAKIFIEKCFNSPIETPSLIGADKTGFTFIEAQKLAKTEKNPLKKFYWWCTKKGLQYAAKISDGVKLGIDTGFDSGSTLDYVYRNQPSGLTGFGRYLDFIYLQAIGWRGIRERKVHLEKLLKKAIISQQTTNKPVHIVDIAAGHGRYILETVTQLPKKPNSILLRDYSELNVQKGTHLIEQKGLREIARFEQGNAFSTEELTNLVIKPTIAIVSGLYELFGENQLLQDSLKGLAHSMLPGSILIYTNQPWHPQLEYIARALTSHREGQQWVMRRRTQLEMDQLVMEAGFTKQEMLIDEWGIFTVSVAIRNNTPSALDHKDE